MSKKTIAVIFGGQSSEHEVSCMSAVTIASAIDTDFYNLFLVGITQVGHWLKIEHIKDITSGAWQDSQISAVLSPDTKDHGFIIRDKNTITIQKVDLIFPILHGRYGEDGTIQGLFELSNIPYVGCGVLSSAVAMDKLYTKIIVDTLNIRQAKYVAVSSKQLKVMDCVINKIETSLSYPVFVKPSNAGSSRGISKAQNQDELIEALHLAVQHDRKILVEEAIIGREIECAVLGGQEAKASKVGEILTNATFYDYDAKYNNQESKTLLSPDLPKNVVEQIQKAAVDIFSAIDGYGISRVDFFVEDKTNEVVFNEINTLPGFTAISMYPMLWEERGIQKKQLVEKLIQLGFNR